MQNDTAVHPNPVWRDRANSLIRAPLAPVRSETAAPSKEWKQLWCNLARSSMKPVGPFDSVTAKTLRGSKQ
jgi:hypothetical protein